jgi:ABC-type polar amino acid transport system ATPase subunit
MDTIDQVAMKQDEGEKDGAAPAVAVADLHKSFGSQKVLNGISLSVKRGETLAVLGRSGTGKSVLLRLVIGLEKPDSGSVRIHGQDIAGLALDQLGEIRKKMGFLFQHAALYDSLPSSRTWLFRCSIIKKTCRSLNSEIESTRCWPKWGWKALLRRCPPTSLAACRNE